MLTAKFDRYEKYVIRKACHLQLASLLRLGSFNSQVAREVMKRDEHTPSEWAEEATDQMKSWEQSKFNPQHLFRNMNKLELSILTLIVTQMDLQPKWEKGRRSFIKKLLLAEFIFEHTN